MRKKLIILSAPLLLLLFIFFSFSGIGKMEDYFPVIEGWEKSEEIRTYNPDNLWDYIDGAADIYLNYDFKELKIAEYKKNADKYIVVEIYLHPSPDHAFGIYSQERPQDGNFISVGAQGYKAEAILNFFAGNCYVKIRSHDESPATLEAIEKIATQLAVNIEQKSQLPAILSFFPEKGKQSYTEQFIAKNFLGHDFLSSAYKADYTSGETTFQLFIFQRETPDQCMEILKPYFEFAEYKGEIAEGTHTLNDKYNGVVSLTWKGRYIWGIVNAPEEKLRIEYMDFFAKSFNR